MASKVSSDQEKINLSSSVEDKSKAGTSREESKQRSTLEKKTNRVFSSTEIPTRNATDSSSSGAKSKVTCHRDGEHISVDVIVEPGDTADAIVKKIIKMMQMTRT